MILRRYIQYSVVLSSSYIVCPLADHVQSADPRDPVLQEALAAEGEGWRLLEHSTECKESDKLLAFQSCSEAIKTYGGCVAEDDEFFVTRMLISCRRECRDYYQDIKQEHLPVDIISHGGLGDFLDQPFGMRLPVCSLTEGYTTKMLTRPVDFAKYLHEYLVPLVPSLTTDGFKKVDIPARLYSNILQMRRKSLETGDINFEKIDPGILNGPVVIVNDKLEKSKLIMVNRTQMITVDKDVRHDIFETLGPLAEEWAGGLKLVPTSIYGIRRYRNRSTLLAHTDKISSHVISVIMNIAQEVQEDWPLNIKDHQGKEHTVYLKAGEMLWYESAKLVHGRQKPFKGSFYDNMFIHYMPRGLWYDEEMVLGMRAMKISEDAVRWSQRNMKQTNWSLAWDKYDLYESNKQLKNVVGLTNKVKLAADDEEETVRFQHILPVN